MSRRGSRRIVAGGLLALAAAGLAALAAAGAAPARAGAPAPTRVAVPVAVVVVPDGTLAARLPALAREGAVGLMVPGAGSTVTRAASLAALLRGRTRNSMLGGLPGGAPLITLASAPARGAGAVTIWVELPPAGAAPRPNSRRYPVAITGGGYRGLLRSSSTRIPGLVSVVDIAPTAVALAQGGRPRITASPAPAGDRAVAALPALDARIADAKDASYAAFLAITAATLFFSGLAWIVRSGRLARSALLAAPVAIATSMALSLAGVGDSPSLIWALSLAAPLGGLLAGWALGGPRRLAAGCALLFAFLLAAMWAVPEAAGLSALGPQPGAGGRFFGMTNAMETLLLVPALLPAVLLGAAWLAPMGLLALATVGLARAGADGGGVIVVLAATGVLALRLRGRRLTVPVLAGTGVAVVALAAAFVGLDALAGGHSHVTTAAGGGPATVITDVGNRLHVSWLKVTAHPGLILAAVWSVIGMAYAALLRRRSALVDAFLCGIVVSLLVNDTPVHVLAFGVLTVAPLIAWESVRRARRTTA